MIQASKKICLFLFLLPLSSCTNNNDSNNELDLVLQIDSYLEDTNLTTMELYYDSNSQLAKYVNVFHGLSTLTFDISYNNGQIISIKETVEYEPPNRIDHSLIFNVSYDANQITLSPEDTNSNGSRKIVINTNNGYIDSNRLYFGDNFDSYNENIFSRDAENNIEKVEQYTKNESAGGILTKTFTYSFTEFESSDRIYDFHNELLNTESDIHWLCKIFNLKISSQNPMKSVKTYEDFEYGFLNVSFEYNVNNKPDVAIYENGYYGFTNIYTYY